MILNSSLLRSDPVIIKWTKWQLVWELLLPNITGLVAFSVYAIKYYVGASELPNNPTQHGPAAGTR